MAWEKGHYNRSTGEFIRSYESGGGGGGGGGSGCLSILLAPFKALFFLAFVMPIKWPFYTFPRFLKRKNKLFFWMYILGWVALFAFAFMGPDTAAAIMDAAGNGIRRVLGR